MARTLDIREEEMVLDPMCGAGGLLVEAARCWPGARYVGLDIDGAQAARCLANAAQAGVFLQVSAGDATSLPLTDASVDKALPKSHACEHGGSATEAAQPGRCFLTCRSASSTAPTQRMWRSTLRLSRSWPGCCGARGAR